jgi:hypothetical protein
LTLFSGYSFGNFFALHTKRSRGSIIVRKDLKTAIFGQITTRDVVHGRKEKVWTADKQLGYPFITFQAMCENSFKGKDMSK